MAFTRPTLTEIANRITADFETRITSAGSLLRNSVLNIMAKVYAGIAHLLWSYLDYNALQIFISTADTTYLDLHASEYGLTREAATQATGSATVTGTATNVIPLGTELSTDDGQLYTVDTAVTLTTDPADNIIDVTASVGGLSTNQDGAGTLTFTTPISGVDSTATIRGAGLTGGADAETDDALRTRILTRKRQPPHGGAAFDYEVWSKEVSGVTRAWAISLISGPGTVGVAFARDDDIGSNIPSASEMATVRAYIVSHTDPATGKTVGAPVTAEAGLEMITLGNLDVNLSISIYPNTTAVQANVTAELDDLILNNGGPEETIYVSDIYSAITSAADLSRASVTLINGLLPTDAGADVTAASNELHQLGTVTYTTFS